MRRRTLRKTSARSTRLTVERVEGRVLLATFTVTNTNDDTNTGSLRWAIGQSNATAGSNTIAFNIATSGVQTINVLSALPTVTVPVTIDGTSEKGYAGTPLIQLDGAAASKGVDGLDISAGGSTVEGLDVTRFGGEGINLSAAGDDVITKDFLGTDPTGTAAQGNGQDGLLVEGNANGNTISGDVISGNTKNGILLNGTDNGGTSQATTGNLIIGNLLGTDVTGEKTLGNAQVGIYVQNAPMTTIGGTIAADRNIVSGNGTGMELYNNSDGSLIEGNYVGTDATGTVALGNSLPGGFFQDNVVFEGMSNSTFGGTVAGSGNLISGGAHFGIDTFGGGSQDVSIEGNLIGTDVTGTKALGNVSGGIVFVYGTSVTVGGTAAGAGNVISGNGGAGIHTQTTATLIQGNKIGTDITGTLPLGNKGDGIDDGGSTGTTIGGTASGAGNVISDNTGSGLVIGSTTVIIEGNKIGTDITGSVALGNAGDGINVQSPATIGGLAAGAANIIANNGLTSTSHGSGVEVGSLGVTILSNSIHDDYNLGIFLNNVKNGQTAPVVTSAISMNTTSTIMGTLTSAAGIYTLQFFDNPTLNPSGNAEGRTLLGTATVTVVGTSANFTAVVPSGFTPGDHITATATDASGDTSQFSVPLTGTGTGNGLGPPTVTATGSPASVHAGQDVTYTFTIANNQMVADAGVAFSDAIPTGTTFVAGMTSTGVPVTFAGGVASAAIGALAVGQTVTVTITLLTSAAAEPSFINTGGVTATTPPVLPGTDTASVTTAVTPTVDLAVGIVGPSGQTLVGQELTYVVTVNDIGPDASTGGILSDTLPTGVNFISATPSFGPAPTLSNGVLTDDYGNLGAGSIFTLTIVVGATAATVPVAIDDASVAGNEFDPNLNNNSASYTSTVAQPMADLGVDISGPAGSTSVGQSLTFVVTVTNNGPDASTGGILADTLPAGVSFVSAMQSSGPAPTLSNGILTDDYGDLAVGSSFTLTIIVNAGVDSVPMAVDSASVVGNEIDPNIGNNAASFSATVTPLADVGVSIVPSAATVDVGVNLVYTVTVSNLGPSPATNVMFSDVLPKASTFVSATADSGLSPGEADGVVTDLIATLPAGASVVVTITIQPTAAAPPSIIDMAGVMANEPDPNPKNNIASATTNVVPAADVAIVSQSITPGMGIEGEPIEITVTVANNGPSTATGVGVVETLPAGLTFVSGSASGGDVTANGGLVMAPVGTLADGSSTVITILAMTTGSGALTVGSEVTASETDPDPANNTATTTINVVALADLSVVLNGPAAGPIYTGFDLTYTAVVANSGPSPATNVVFADPLFAGASLVSVEANGLVGSVVDGVVELNLGTIAAGASVSVTLTVVPTEPGTFTDTATVSATESDPDPTNNASSVSTTVIVPQSIITFASPNYAVDENGGFAAITLDRSGFEGDDVTVHFSTFGGNATPGVDYTPTSQTVDFPAGSTQATVLVPVLENPHDNHNEIVGLAIDSPTGSGVLATNPTTATLTIVDIDPVLVGPTVTALKLSGYVNSINSIEVDTTGGLDPATANNPANYTLTAFGGVGKQGLPLGTVVPIEVASYNPATGAITLTPSSPLPGNELFLVDINGTRPGAVRDLAGNPLNSIYGSKPGSDYLLSVARGTDIVYPNENGDPVTLKLTGPGTIDIDRYVAGDLEILQVVGGVANKTVITGTVHPTLRRSKIATILGIGPFGSIRVKLTTPPFYVANTVYPNAETQVDAPAIDTLLPSPPVVPIAKVKPRKVATNAKHPHAAIAHPAKAHAVKAHAAEAHRPPARHHR